MVRNGRGDDKALPGCTLWVQTTQNTGSGISLGKNAIKVRER
jgi:hypothetical protein